MLHIGVDTGGTFTDVVLIDRKHRRIVTYKLLSTPDNPAKAVLDGIREALARAGEDTYDRVIHGSTVATNALLEGKGARTAFVTTRGFEDTLWIARQDRPQLYTLAVARPAPPVPRTHCLGVAERMTAEGKPFQPLEASAIQEIIDRLQDLEVEAVAISLLHSYANAAHERQLAEALRQALPGVHITRSSELLPEFREYERGATCVVNAVVAPPMIRYLNQLSETMGEHRLRIMASSGGTLGPVQVARRPVQTILSGPAGGVVGGYAMGTRAGVFQIITLDMGGTSTDVSLCDGGIRYTMESEIAHLPVRLPVVDIHTVGAGGGSIAWQDAGGALRVGPQSVGADPGPVCYGKQQPPYQPAVTDAHVVLGHLRADRPLGGTIYPDRDAARAALATLGASLGLGVEETAEGILRVAEATMARAIQRISVQRGYDPRGYVLMPFGGAGAMHACRLADFVGMRRVLVPRYPGLLSAWGMLHAAPLHTLSQAVMRVLRPDATGNYPNVHRIPEVQRVMQQLRRKAEALFESEGIPEEERQYEFRFDLRYRGQSYELSVPAEGDPLQEFQQQHELLYGYYASGKPIELVNVRLYARGTAPEVVLEPLPRREGAMPEGEEIEVYESGAFRPWRYLDRDHLRAGDVLTGRTIVGEYSATTVIPPHWQGKVDTYGQLHLWRTV